MRSYGTFNRVIWEKFQTVRLIQTVRIIESTEYLPISKKTVYLWIDPNEIKVMGKWEF